MSQLDTPQGYQTSTFRERGVYMPVTTPMLTGARARLTDRDGLELVVPKALGGRGNYLTPWDNVADLCELGVHDIRLLDRVGRLRMITPASVRDAGLETAAEGFAGRRVRAAALAAIAADEQARARTHYHLLLALVRHMDPGSIQAGPVPPADLAPMATRAIDKLAARLQWRRDNIASGLAKLAPLFAPLGLGERVGTARVPALLVTLQRLRQSVAALPVTTNWEAQAIGLILRTIDITLSCMTSALGEARGLALNTPDLFRSWMTDPASVVARIGRAEWLADGWTWLCRFWSLAPDTASQRAQLEEVVLVLPSIPDEVAQWTGFGSDTVLPPHTARLRLPEDYTEHNLIDAILRNERLLALAA